MAKKRAGKYNINNVKTSSFLPGVFQTELNKSWLDSTLDQMVSKGPLDQINGYIGSRHGSQASVGDEYINPTFHKNIRTKTQLQPGIITKYSDNKTDRIMSFDDVVHAIESNFSEYNYNAAYATNHYTFRPNVNTDKFVNYKNYFWVEELPVYESVFTGTQYNPVAEALGESVYELVDDNNSVLVENNMLIKFTGAGYDSSIEGNTYLVTGVGFSINFILYIENVNGKPKRRYTNITKHTQRNYGHWDNNLIISVDPNTNSTYWTLTSDPEDKTPFYVTNEYNNDTNRLPVFDGFIFTDIETNPHLFYKSFVKFSDAWNFYKLEKFNYTGSNTFILSNPLDNSAWQVEGVIIERNGIKTATSDYTIAGQDLTINSPALLTGDKINITVKDNGEASSENLYYADTKDNGDVILKHVVLANYDINLNVVTSYHPDATAELIDLVEKAQQYDEDYFDFGNPDIPLKDYFVIDKNDVYGNAWSRTNSWVNITTIKKLETLLDEDLKDLSSSNRQAIRPILEYSNDSLLWNSAGYTGAYTLFKGIVDFGVRVSEENEVPNDSKYVFIDDVTDNTIYYKDINGVIIPESVLQDHQTFFIKSVINRDDIEWEKADVYSQAGEIKLAQQKTYINQYPLYRYFDINGTPLEEIEGVNFEGGITFGYKEGTGRNDPELGIPLSYVDTPKGAEYQFENFLITRKFKYSCTNIENDKIYYSKPLEGFNFFKRRHDLQTLYITSNTVLGAKENKQYIIEATEPEVDLIIPVGFNNWRPYQEILLFQLDNDLINSIASSVIVSEGVYSKRMFNNRHVLPINTEFTVHNLCPDTDIVFYGPGGVDIENPLPGQQVPDITITRNGRTCVVTTGPNSDNQRFRISYTNPLYPRSFSFSISKYADKVYYDVTKNGQAIEDQYITVTNNEVKIDGAVLEKDDIIDFNWRNNDQSNSTDNISFPDIMLHNSNNKPVETFTISETLPHWKSVLGAIPGITGDLIGENNYAELTKTVAYGGTIHMHQDSNLMNDLNFESTELNITGSLLEQGNDWDTFKTRFISQAQRLYATRTYTSVYDFTNDIINSLIKTRRNNDLYIESNMVYSHNDAYEEFEITEETSLQVFETKYTFNGDRNIRDHLYVYLSDNKDLGGKWITRQLCSETDYEFVGNKIRLRALPRKLGIKNPVLRIHYHQMHEASYVPSSLVKLNLQYGYAPCIKDNTLYTHDGCEIKLKAGGDIFDMESPDFDPVSAALYELELRVYAGLVRNDRMYTDSYSFRYDNSYKYFPSEHRGTWYSLELLNNYLEKYYYQWSRLKNITSLNIENYFDVSDPFTWNYSSIILGEHFAPNKLPGHYKGAYIHIFGTSTPDITPWHMLGYSNKPTWWNTYYSWTDPTKRAKLIEALRLGIYSKPEENVRQDVSVARYYWDWDNKCPVDTSGNIVSPELVLGEPSEVDRAQNFVFGDWGPVEQQWRHSQSGQAIMLDAVVKLNPARAWTSFFQPRVTDINGIVIADTNIDTFALPNAKSYRVPGNVYDYSIKAVFVNECPATVNRDTKFFIVDNRTSSKAELSFVLDNFDPLATTGTVGSFSLVDQGINFTGIPIICSTQDATELDGLDVDIEIEKIPYVANGISQAQYNYIKRNQYTVDLYNLYTTVGTQLMEKVGGFTNKDLLDVFVESSPVGGFQLSEGDYSIHMYRGYPTEFVTASAVFVTKTLTGFEVNGISDNKQEFRFFEPNIAGANAYKTIDINGATVRRYSKFVSTPSIVEFGSTFAKIQDGYNFIRGYWKWMEDQGYTLEFSGNATATDFVEWAQTADLNDAIILQIGRSISFKPDHGYVYPYNDLCYNNNSVLTIYNARLEHSDLSVNRKDNTVYIETKEQEFIGGITSAVLDYEHIVVFENKTTFGVDMFEDIKNKKQHRLYVRGQRTSSWAGEKKAPGYLVFDDHIVQNFDSAVQQTDDFYRTDVNEFNKAITKAKDLSIGNIDREWISSLGLSKDVITKFYQGVIKQKGTDGAIERIGRSTLVDNGRSVVSAYEKFMFRQSPLGNDILETPLEIEVTSKDINSSPQVITFDYNKREENGILYVTDDMNITKQQPSFEITDFHNSKLGLLTGGDPLINETKYSVLDMSALPGVFDSTEEYAKIPTWDSGISYRLGDRVRYKGELWECNVDYTGLNVTTDDIVVTGTVTNPSFPYGTVANIAGTSVTFESINTEYQNITAIGSTINPTIYPSETLIIDNVSIPFVGSEEVTVVIDDAVLLANSGPAFFSDVTGKSIVINGVTVDFDITPADVVENFTGTDITPANVVETFILSAPQQIFTIAQTLSPTTYSVDTVEVDGTPTTDFTLVGQTLTINTPVTLGTETIVVTLTHVTVLEDTFTISTPLTPTTYSVGSVTVNGTGSAYTVAGQDVILSTPPAAGSNIVVTLEHVPAQMNVDAIISHILSYSITGLTVNKIGDIDRIELRFTTTDPNATLTLGPSPTNTDLGFSAQGAIARPISEIQLLPSLLGITEIVNQINSTSGLDNITASNNNGHLVVTKVVTSTDNTMTVTGTARTIFGLDTIYNANTTDVEISTSMSTAIQTIAQELINNNITDVNITELNNRIVVSSSADELDMGNTTFNSIAGLVTGIITANEGDVENIGPGEDAGNETPNFVKVDKNLDPALFNILVADDSKYTVEQVGDVPTKFFGWNVFQAQYANIPLYSKSNQNIASLTGDQAHCGICAGVATRDGNDAEVTTNVAHNLQVGDYVMLLNTTTVPNIDGIHKITKLGYGAGAERVFYIDEYIEECGDCASILVLRTQRFRDKDQLLSAEASTSWNIPTGALSYTSLLAQTEADTSAATYVFEKKDSYFEQIRSTVYRPTNTDIDNIVVYNFKDNRTIAQLEVWDPIRKIIPGVAQLNIDYDSIHDNAVYNTSTDEYYATDENSAWNDTQLGVRWWDTKRLRYYDYDQGSYGYKSIMWGKQFPGSEVIVWEWTKSNVPPDDYTEAVLQQKEMFGVLATGEAYSIYNEELDENLYYYTTTREWNKGLGKYETFYYFWVKNKETLTDTTKTLTARETADIISDPTANGISWFAALSNDTFLVSNINYLIEDENTVLQVNKSTRRYDAHNEWTLITEDKDIIPEYYIERMKDNLSAEDKTGQRIPYLNLHKFNRYGDSVGQSWFKNISDARRNAIVTINDLLADINLHGALNDTWWKKLDEDEFPPFLWAWADYVDINYTGTFDHTAQVKTLEELATIDNVLHKVVKINILETTAIGRYDDVVNLDRSEIYHYDGQQWNLVYKYNSTVQFNEDLLAPYDGWDKFPFDSHGWDDSNVGKYWITLISALVEDIFVNYDRYKTNKLFFSIVYYILSNFEQTNWIRKTTYVRIDIVNQFDNFSRKYKRDKLNEVVGYIETVKPFHTKIDTLSSIYNTIEETKLTVSEDVRQSISVEFKEFDAVYGGDIISAPDFTDTEEYDVYTGGEFTDVTFDDTLVAYSLANPEMFNYNSEGDNRNNLVAIKPSEHVAIYVQNNPVGATHTADTRTFAHVQDNNGYAIPYGLSQNKSTTLVNNLLESDTEFEVVDASSFAEYGYLIMKNEIIKYYKYNNIINIVERRALNTFGAIHEAGDTVIDITDSVITNTTDNPSAPKYNIVGQKLLESTGSIEANELQNLGAGIEL